MPISLDITISDGTPSFQFAADLASDVVGDDVAAYVLLHMILIKLGSAAKRVGSRALCVRLRTTVTSVENRAVIEVAKAAQRR